MSFRRPGQELESIRHHAPDAWETLFIFLGAGVALGGFLWLVLPFYNDWWQIMGTWFIEQSQYWIGEPGPVWLMSVHLEHREVFCWLDFFMITVTMVTVIALSALVLSVASLASAMLVLWLWRLTCGVRQHSLRSCRPILAGYIGHGQ